MLVARLVFLQVVRYEDLAAKAEANRIAIVPIVPNRGLIVDRNGVVLASDYAAYTLEIMPAKLDRPLDEVIDDLAQMVEVTPRDRRRFKRELEETKTFESLPLRTKLTDTEVARFTAQRFRFPVSTSKQGCFATTPMDRWPAMCWATSAGSISVRRRPWTIGRRSSWPTTEARTTSANSASNKATRVSCTA